jgi:O-antigen ligase
MLKYPWGVGANQFGMVVPEYGFRPGKQAHTLWLQVGAEVGFVGLGCLLLFYGTCIARLWRLAREGAPVTDPWFGAAARMVISGLIGFAVSAQFVSLTTLEVPFYIVLIGAALLKLSGPVPGLPSPPSLVRLPDAFREPTHVVS